MAGFIKDNKLYIAVAESDSIRENRLAGWTKGDSITSNYYISDNQETKDLVVKLLEGKAVGTTENGKNLYEYDKPVYTSKEECKIFSNIMKTRVKAKYAMMFENKMADFEKFMQKFLENNVLIASKLMDTGTRPYFTFDGNENWKDFLKIIYGEITYIVIENKKDHYLVYPQFHPMFIKSNEFEIQFDESELDNYNVFGIHIKKKNSALDTNNPHVCIGWSTLGDLSLVSSKQELKDKYQSIWPNYSSYKVGADVSQIWMFINEMRINDFIVYFNEGFAHIGKVVSDYYYSIEIAEQDCDYVNNKRVEWIKDVQYNDLPSEYKRSAFTQKSMFRLNSYKPLIEEILKGKSVEKDEFDDYTDDEESTNILPVYDFASSKIEEGKNLIIYGTPGCGKSYYVQHTLLKNYKEDDYVRTTFFQDYTNTDFVGQILPVIDGDKVTYQFNPGPFTLALEKAIKNPDKNIALVIEELNRGSAASIFGDIFQLLDRKHGLSEYPILNVNIINYLNKQFDGKYEFKEIRIPGNLNIYATMNTSDQNVFTLDTAFKRRWKFKKLVNEFALNHAFKDYYVPGADITWEKMVNIINDYILDTSNGLNGEDKQLGVYFVDESCMRKEAVSKAAPEQVKEFAHKVLEYLWADVAKFDHKKWFGDIRSLDELIKKYEENGLEVFNHGIFNK